MATTNNAYIKELADKKEKKLKAALLSTLNENKKSEESKKKKLDDKYAAEKSETLKKTAAEEADAAHKKADEKAKTYSLIRAAAIKSILGGKNKKRAISAVQTESENRINEIAESSAKATQKLKNSLKKKEDTYKSNLKLVAEEKKNKDNAAQKKYNAALAEFYAGLALENLKKKK